MCSYNVNDKCTITQERCPFVYFCEKAQTWKPLRAMPEQCKVQVLHEIPRGYCVVRFEKKGYLYVDLGDRTIQILNPFEEVPKYVKVSKTKNGWRVRK